MLAGLAFAGRLARELGWNALDAAAGRRGGLPRDAAGVTPAFLSSALQDFAEGVVVSHVESLGLESGTTSRARLALAFEGPLPRADLPDRMFVKLAPSDLRTRLFVGLLGLGRTEVAFYRTARPELPVRAPEVYFAAAARHGPRFLLLLEDLEARGCRFADLAGACDVPRAEAVMRALARLHAGFWESPRLHGDLAWLGERLAGPAFRTGLFLSAAALRPALRRFGELVPAGLRGAAHFVMAQRPALEAAWRRPPLTLIHGDAHAGNLFFDGPEVGLLDWQVAQLGQGMRDVSYFLANSLEVETRRAHGEALIRLYLDRLADAGGPALPFSLAWEQFRLHALYAWISALVAAAATTLQRERIVRAALQRSSAAVVDLESLAALRELVEA